MADDDVAGGDATVTRGPGMPQLPLRAGLVSLEAARDYMPDTVLLRCQRLNFWNASIREKDGKAEDGKPSFGQSWKTFPEGKEDEEKELQKAALLKVYKWAWKAHTFNTKGDPCPHNLEVVVRSL